MGDVAIDIGTCMLNLFKAIGIFVQTSFKPCFRRSSYFLTRCFAEWQLFVFLSIYIFNCVTSKNLCFLFSKSSQQSCSFTISVYGWARRDFKRHLCGSPNLQILFSAKFVTDWITLVASWNSNMQSTVQLSGIEM